MVQAKQIQGCLDLSSRQEVTGQKTFSTAQIFTGPTQSIVLSDGYIYWVNDPLVLDELNNSRLSISNGVMVIEVYNEGRWNAQ